MLFPTRRIISLARIAARFVVLVFAFSVQSVSAQVKIESVARQTKGRLHDVENSNFVGKFRSHTLSDNINLGPLGLPEREVARMNNVPTLSTAIVDYDSDVTTQRFFLDSRAEANLDPMVPSNLGAVQRGTWCDSSGFYEVVFSSPTPLFFSVTAAVTIESKDLPEPFVFVSSRFKTLDDYLRSLSSEPLLLEGPVYVRGPQSTIKLTSLDSPADTALELVNNAKTETAGALKAGRWKLRVEFEACGIERVYARTTAKLDLQLEVLDAPKITSAPSALVVTTGRSATLSVEATGRLLSYQWSKDGKVIEGATQATYSIAKFSTADEGAYSVEVSNAGGKATSTISVSKEGPPSIVTQPANVIANLGGTATFQVISNSTAPLSYQWQFNGVAINGATSATYVVSSLKAASAGNYTVVVSNVNGSTTSSVATLTAVGGPGSPAISGQPASHTIASGSTVVFTVTPSGAVLPAALLSGDDRAGRAVTGATFQWQLNGATIAGATSAQLVISNAGTANAGVYTCLVTSAGLSTLSSPATLTVEAATNFGRLVNLSILTDISTTGPSFTLGTVIGGARTSGVKPLLVRAVGPSLTPLGVGGALADPKLELLAGQTLVAFNDDWDGLASLANVFTQLGAFGYAATSSKDAAIFNSATATGSYTVQISGVGGATGRVIAELYDGTPSSAFAVNTPRLINVSVLKPIDAGSTLTAGFVVGGATSKTVLLRAIGPQLGLPPFNIGGVMADPKLDLFNGATVIATNDNWGGDSQLTAVGNSVGAFAVADGASKDAILLVTLAPGSYTAQVTGVGSTGGLALIEVYEVP